MVVKLKGVILKISETVHDNRLLFVLTQERGRIQIFDNRYRTGSKKGNTVDLCTYCEFVVYESNGKYTLNSVEVIERFYQMRKSIEATTLAGYLSQLCLFATQDGNIVHDELPSLMLNSLYLLAKDAALHPKVKAVFEWKIIQILGFTPSLEMCTHASFDGRVLMSTEDGGLYCPDCIPAAHNAPAFEVQASEVKAIGYILEQPPAKAFSFKISDASMLAIGHIAEEYLKYQCSQTFSALELYKTIG